MTPDPERIFIAWLDKCGSALSDALSKWIGRVLPGVQVAFAPDVRADSHWQTTLPLALHNAGAALVCVVGEQASSPWVHLQLGACFRALGTGKPVVPVLLDVPESFLSTSPLGMFQAVRPSKEDFRRLVRDLSRSFTNGDNEGSVLRRFEATCDDLLYDLDSVPGTSTHDFQIVLVLPNRVLPVPNSAPFNDEEWTSVVSRMTAIQSLPDMGLEKFESVDLECLDLAREEWMRAPRLVSRLMTRNIALVHRTVTSQYQREAKAIAKYVKHRLMKYEGLAKRSI